MTGGRPRAATQLTTTDAATLGAKERAVYMIVDIETAMPVGGPYLDLEHSRDAWHWLIAPGLSLSHLELFVRDRQDLVDQVRTWHDDYLLKRQSRRDSREGAARGCCG